MHGLYLLWWVQETHVPPAIAASVLAAGDLVLVGLELPTGWLADRFGHRWSLVLGSLFQIGGIAWCWLGEGPVGLVTASVLIAGGDALRSGADQALLYRSCVFLTQESAFQKIHARASAIELFALVGLVVAGGAIVTRWGFAAGWMAETALCVLGLVLACAFVEPPPAPDPSGTSTTSASGHKARWLEAVSVVLSAALLGALASAAAFLAQTASTADPVSATTLVAMITLAEAAGAAVAARCGPSGMRLQALLALCGVVLAGVALAVPASFEVAVLGLTFLTGLAHPLRDTAIQALASDGIRARAASLANAIDMIFSTITLPLTGFFVRR